MTFNEMNNVNPRAGTDKRRLKTSSQPIVARVGYMLTLYIVYNYRILYMPNAILIAIPNVSIHT